MYDESKKLHKINNVELKLVGYNASYKKDSLNQYGSCKLAFEKK